MNQFTYILAVQSTACLIFLCTTVYGLLTPWYRSRTGIGFFSLLCSMLLLNIITIFRVRGAVIDPVVGTLSWTFLFTTLFFGVLWNLIYKQFFQGHSDQIGDTRKNKPGRHQDEPGK